MKIDDTIAALQALKTAHGNIEVEVRFDDYNLHGNTVIALCAGIELRPGALDDSYVAMVVAGAVVAPG